MKSNNSQLNRLLDNLEQSKSYLISKSASEASYKELIDQLDSKFNFLSNNSKPTIRLVSTSEYLVSQLKAKSEAVPKLRSLYNFEAVSPFKNIPEIVKGCGAIFLVFQSHQIVTQHQYKLVKLAQKNQVFLSILVTRSERNNSPKTVDEYLELQDLLAIKDYLFAIDSFFDFNQCEDFKLYENYLCDRAATLLSKVALHHSLEVSNKIKRFFAIQINTNWRQTKQIKSEYLESREVNNYQQQVLTKTFNKISQQQQQTILAIKQQLNQSRSSYTNPFMPDSWFFELQEIIERSQIKLVKEKAETYLYLVIKNGDRLEYIYSYILNLYQDKVIDVLDSQWSKINYSYADGGLSAFVTKANKNIAQISILESYPQKATQINLNLEPFPKLNLSQIINFNCLKTNSRLAFDYNYTQSSWFKLLILGSIGVAIYLITKIYFGEGRYIGFVILIFQVINIFTGQSIKQVKLKSHKKELQRTISNKYQTLVRLVIEQMIQSSIANLDRKNNQYKADINVISELAQNKLDTIKQDITQSQARKNRLEKDKAHLLSLWN